MHISLITLFPEVIDSLNYGITGRALQKGLLKLKTFNPRDYTTNPTGRVDDRHYGGGPGMVMQVQPLRAAINAAKQLSPKTKTLYLSPQGKRLNQAAVQTFSQEQGLILLAGRYEGIDQRVIDHDIDEEWSIGDYVLSGGELPALVLIDAITRLLPGALGHDQSAEQDSFSNGLLDCPHYTRPELIDGQSVPDVLLSGDHQAITRFRLEQSLVKTWQMRPNLVKRRALTKTEAELLKPYLSEEDTHE